jgi:hypothetical protein
MGMREPSQHQINSVGITVCELAYTVFEICKAADDFCIQSTSNLVFGGTNRIVWSARYGFLADRSYCTPRFLACFDEWKQSTE